MGRPLSQIADQYGDRVNLYAVFPLKNSNYKTINKFKIQYKLQGFESILDKDQSWTKRLGATVTPEVVVTDEDGEILYKGRINDAYFAPGKIRHGARNNDLKKVLDLVLSGLPVSKPWKSAIGCFITFY